MTSYKRKLVYNTLVGFILHYLRNSPKFLCKYISLNMKQNSKIRRKEGHKSQERLGNDTYVVFILLCSVTFYFFCTV